jgi:hypothetical protein
MKQNPERRRRALYQPGATPQEGIAEKQEKGL